MVMGPGVMSNLIRCYSKRVLVFIPSYKYLKHCLEIGDETQDKINSLIRGKKAPTITIQHTPIIPSPGIPFTLPPAMWLLSLSSVGSCYEKTPTHLNTGENEKGPLRVAEVLRPGHRDLG